MNSNRMSPWNQGMGALLKGLTFGFLVSQVLAVDVDPVLVGSCQSLRPGSASALAVSGRYAYVVGSFYVEENSENEGLQVVDILDRKRPQRVGGCDTRSVPLKITVWDNRAYIVGRREQDSNYIYSLELIDLFDPAKPEWVGRYDIVGYDEASHPFPAVAVAGGYAYLATGPELIILDVSYPSDLRRKGSYTRTTGISAVAIAPSSGCVAVAGWDGPIDVLNASDPINLRKVAELPFRTSSLTTVGNYAYAYGIDADDQNGEAGVMMVDLTDPSQPVRRAWFAPEGGGIVVGGVGVDENHLCLTINTGNSPQSRTYLQVFDLSNPATAKPVGTFLGNGADLKVSGGYLYVAGVGLDIIDISKPANPQPVGFYDTGGSGTVVAVSEDHAYVNRTFYDGESWTSGLEIVDIADPASPQQVGFVTNISPGKMIVSESNAYALAWDTGAFLALDIADRANPRRTGVLPGVWGQDFCALGNYVYLAGHSLVAGIEMARLLVIDVSNTMNLKKVGESYYLGEGGGRGIAAAGDYAYLTTVVGLLVISIQDPAYPRPVGVVADVVGGDVAISGHHAFVVGSKRGEVNHGIQMVDVSEPANPKWVAEYETGGRPDSITVMGNHAYVAGGYIGVQVIDISDPEKPRRSGGNSSSVWPGSVVVDRGRVLTTGGVDGLVILQMQPLIKAVSRDGSRLNLAWESFGAARLQRATRLSDPDWQDLIGSENLNSISLPIWGGSEFFRVVRPE